MKKTEAVEEYLARRSAAERLNLKVPDDYPCRNCQEAVCCTKDALMTVFDAQYILEAIRRGEIISKVAEWGRINALDRNNDRCPFLDLRTNKCTIYAHRPLICMIYGYGLVVNSREAMEEALSVSILAKKDKGIKVDDKMGFHMCERIGLEHLGLSRRIPIEVVLNFAVQKSYLNEIPSKQKIRVDRFAREILLNKNRAQRVITNSSFH